MKLECEKLATEKTEIQRHYVMVSELHLKGGGRWGVSPLNHQRTRSPGMLWFPLALGLCGQALRSGSCGCYCLSFPQNELWCLSRACCRSLRWRSRSRAAFLLSHGQRAGAPAGPCLFCGLRPCAGETSAPGRGAGGLFSPPGLARVWAFVAGLTPHGSSKLSVCECPWAPQPC